MAVVNGQEASATTFNDAFLSRSVDCDTTAVITLANTSDPDSGSSIQNVQRFINEIASAAGIAGQGDAAATTYSSNNVVANSETYKESIGRLDAAFDISTGHTHDGSDSALVSALDLSDLNHYRADWFGITVTSASGSSFNITSSMSGKVPGGGTSVVGVVTSSPYNKCEIREATTDTYVEDAGGQRVYGRITESSGTWTISFYTNEAGVETAHTLSTQDLKIAFREVFTVATIPTFGADSGFLSSFDLTADIPYATTSLAGKVQLSNSAGAAVAGTGAIGSSTDVARADHAHAGVHSLAGYGVAGSPLLGDVEIEAGTRISLSYSSGRLVVTNTGPALTSTTPSAIASASALGSATDAARADHTHEGTHQISIYSNGGSPLKGDVEFEAGTNITLDYNSGRLRIAASGAGTYANNTPAYWRNAANSADIELVNLNASDEGIFGDVSGAFSSYLKLKSSGTRVTLVSDTGSGTIEMRSAIFEFKGSTNPVARFYDGDNSNYVGLKAPTTVASNFDLTLPDTIGSAGQALVNSGTPGVLAWGTSGGGGGSIKWTSPDGNGALPTQENGYDVFLFASGDTQFIWTLIKVPSTYISGRQINLDVAIYSPSASGTIQIDAASYLVRQGTDAIDSTTNARTITGSALTNTVAKMYRKVAIDLTDSSGQINGVAVAANDIIRVSITRASGSDSAELRFVESASELRM